MIDKFPYPPKIPGGSRFPDTPDYTNYQELDEEPVNIAADDFKTWGFYKEDERFARLTRVGMDKQNRCVIQRRYGELNKHHRLEWIDYHFVVKRNILASCLAVAVMQGNNTFEKYCQMMERLDSLVPPTGNPEIDGPAPIVMTQERYNQLQKEKRERERKELEERKQRCAYFWDKVVWEDDECSLFFECDQPVMICHGKRFSFGCDGREPMAIIYGDGITYLHNGFDVGDECRYFLKNPQGTILSITGRKYDAESFCHLLFAAATIGGEWVSIDEAEKRFEEMMAYKKRKDVKNILEFPYPAKKPGGCRFPAGGDNSKTVWKDGNRHLYFEDHDPILIYKGERYTFSCQPYEPMAIILHKGEAVVHIHNAFYPDECKGFIENSRYLVSTITGKHHNAERFCRLLTTAIDGFFDCQIDEVESKMQKDLVLEKGLGSIQFETRDFKCDKVLYEGINLLIGHFENALSKENHIEKIYSIAFGYPNRNSDYFEYYLLSEQEYHEFMKWPEKRQWKDKEEAFDWEHKNLEGKRKELCNEFSQNPGIYKPCFTLDEISGFTRPKAKPSYRNTIRIHYSRQSVCAADDYINHELEIVMPDNAKISDLVEYIRYYHDDSGYSCIPFTGGDHWWALKLQNRVIAYVNEDDSKGVRYSQYDRDTPLRSINVSKVYGTRKI